MTTILSTTAIISGAAGALLLYVVTIFPRLGVYLDALRGRVPNQHPQRAGTYEAGCALREHEPKRLKHGYAKPLEI